MWMNGRKRFGARFGRTSRHSTQWIQRLGTDAPTVVVTGNRVLGILLSLYGAFNDPDAES